MTNVGIACLHANGIWINYRQKKKEKFQIDTRYGIKRKSSLFPVHVKSIISEPIGTPTSISSKGDENKKRIKDKTKEKIQKQIDLSKAFIAVSKMEIWHCIESWSFDV